MPLLSTIGPRCLQILITGISMNYLCLNFWSTSWALWKCEGKPSFALSVAYICKCFCRIMINSYSVAFTFLLKMLNKVCLHLSDVKGKAKLWYLSVTLLARLSVLRCYETFSNKKAIFRILLISINNFWVLRPFPYIVWLATLNANPTKWLNTLKQFVGNSRRIVWVWLTILWGWRWKF